MKGKHSFSSQSVGKSLATGRETKGNTSQEQSSGIVKEKREQIRHIPHQVRPHGWATLKGMCVGQVAV